MPQQKNSSSKPRDRFLLVILSLALVASLLGAERITGKITADGGEPIAGALVKLQGKGGVQTAVSLTGPNGAFDISAVPTDSALLTVEKGSQLLYRAIISTKGNEPVNINLIKPFHLTNWHPEDLSSDLTNSTLVLDQNGDVSRILNDASGSRRERLFSVPPSYEANSIAATDEAIYVTSNSSLGCTLFRFVKSTGVLSRKIGALSSTCLGIASDGTSIYVTFMKPKQLWSWSDWSADHSKAFDLYPLSDPGTLTFDALGQRLLIADTTGKLYSLLLSSGKLQLLTTDVGYVTSIATTEKQILMTSGKKILAINRANNRGENPPSSLQILTGGHLTGVARDGSGNIWYADYDNGTVAGPIK